MSQTGEWGRVREAPWWPRAQGVSPQTSTSQPRGSHSVALHGRRVSLRGAADRGFKDPAVQGGGGAPCAPVCCLQHPPPSSLGGGGGAHCGVCPKDPGSQAL